MRVLGFMSGTSLDGVDAAILETDGKEISALGPAVTVALTDEERAAIVAMTDLALAGQQSALALRAAQNAVHASHLRAVAALEAIGGQFELAGFHGQTVVHRPADKFTWQIGDPARLADALNVPVVADFRQADLAAGGLGAPLVPIYHAALARFAKVAGPVAFLNIGGVANVTFIDAAGTLHACDTGPGNGMMDLLLQQRGEGRYDDGGRRSAAGKCDDHALAVLLAATVLHGSGPRALDRYDIALDPVAGLSTEDALATLVQFTAECVGRAAKHLPAAPQRWLVCGGGRYNPTLMNALRCRLSRCDSIDILGLRGDFVEAEAMAFLAMRSVQGQPITFPGTTGVNSPICGGIVFDPAAAANRVRKARA